MGFVIIGVIFKGSDIMLNMNNQNDISKMMQYYRTSDMLNLSYFFPELSPVRNLTIIENINDYYDNKDN